MKCYSHNDRDAIGVCKACSKGVCSECAYDTGNGLACKETCIEEVQAINEIISRNRQMYSIGNTSNVLSSSVIMYFLFAVLFGGWGIYNSLTRGRLDAFTLLMGAGMLVVGIIAYTRQKKLKLQC